MSPTRAKTTAPRIFVQIAAYRDPECQPTVADLFAKAAHPRRVTVGVCWQHLPEEDSDLFVRSYPFPSQVRVLKIDARKSQGACWARAKVQTLHRGEEYTLQIDSHMRFEPGWDDALIAMLHACPSQKAVLTAYPAGYTPPDHVERREATFISALQFNDDGVFTMRGQTMPPLAAPMPGAFVGACLLFGRSSIITDIPYDPHLYFFGEEITLAARLWTHGYDIYHPQISTMYHRWERDQRRTHFEDHGDWVRRNQRSFARVRHLLGTETSRDPEVLRDLDRYGLGSARSLQDYQAFCGVDFARRTIAPDAYAGRFPVRAADAGAAADASRARPSVLEAMAAVLSGLRDQVYFLQIGAMDGRTFDPLYEIILRHRWHGVLVEPMPHHFERLAQLHQGREGLRLVNLAVGNARGREPFHYVDPALILKHGLPTWVDGICSLLEEHVRGQEVYFNDAGFRDIMEYVSTASVETTTLPELLVAHPLDRVDVLQIDAEGFDYQILRQWRFGAQRPAIINLGFARLSGAEKKATMDLLLAEGYSVSLQGLDLLALQPELLVAPRLA